MHDGKALLKDPALTVGVSFKPGSLLSMAKAHGSHMCPVVGYSAIVSRSVAFYLATQGEKIPAGILPDDLQKLADTCATVLEAQRLGINVRAELTAILQRSQGPSAA